MNRQEAGVCIFLKRVMMAKENAPLSRKEEEEKKTAEAQQQSGYMPGKLNATYSRMMNKLSPLKGGSMFKKKANVSQPGDASEIQADAVAKAVTEGNANAAQVELQNNVTSGEITAKASDVSIETPPGFEEQIEKMKGSGLPLPDDKKANLEEMLGTDLDHVRLHTGSDAAELSADINALAFATGDDIFYPGDLNDEGLLAHEVAHTLQEVDGISGKISRFEAPGHEAAERVGLTKNNMFSNDEVSMIYIGNWMRDMNQVFVPAFTNMLGADTTFALVAYSGFKKFGRAFTSEQFGYYIPAEHIDNPAGQLPGYDYSAAPPAVGFKFDINDRFKTSSFPAKSSSNTTKQASNDPQKGLYGDASIYAVDSSSNMSVYILRTNDHVETRLSLAAELGRTPDGMLHFGAALHAVEDLFAHSNFVEIALNILLKEKNESEFLPELKKEKGERVIQTLAPDLNGNPVLLTGSFTGNDTLVSVGSEVVKMMREGLGLPATKEEEKIQDALTLQLLASMDKNMKNDPELRKKTAETLGKAGAPASVTDGIQDGTTSLHDTYNTLLFYQEKLSNMKYFIPAIIRVPISNTILSIKIQFRAYISEALKLLADQLEASILEVKVKDTTLINAQKDQQAVIDSKGKKQSKIAEFANKYFDAKLPTPAENLKNATEHQNMIKALPQGVQAGPSHSQLAKDHEDSIFHGLAFMLASEADNKIGEKMVTAWNNKSQYADPATGLLTKPDDQLSDDQKEQKLMHKKRVEADQKSLKWGKGIIDKGHSEHVQYDLNSMRKESAQHIRSVANAMDSVLLSPANAKVALSSLQQYLRAADKKDNYKQIHDLVDNLINSAKSTAQKLDNAVQKTELKSVITNLNTAADKVEKAETLKERELAYESLNNSKEQLLKWVASISADNKSVYNTSSGVLLYSVCLTLLNREIAVVAPAYTTEQSDLLKKAPVVGVKVQRPDISKKAPAIKTLLETSRVYMNHPSSNDWWKQLIINYAKKFSATLSMEIKARNSGYSKFREK